MSLRRWVTPFPWRIVAKLTCLVLLLVAANLAVHEIAGAMDFQIRAGNEDMVHRTIMLTAALYAVLLAIPFVPGAEIGLAMITMLGPPIAFLVYVCTVAGLCLSFLAGRLVPLSGLIGLADYLSLRRTSKLLEQIEPLDRQERLSFLASRAPNRFVPLLLRYRYLALAVAFNVPGNFLIGGGGGIALIAGASRLYSLPVFFLTIMLAVAPVPFAVLFLGSEFLMR